MHSNLQRTDSNRIASRRALAQNCAFSSMLGAIVALVVALSLDLTCIVPILAGKNTYNPIRDFLSYQVDAQSGQLMTGVFLLLAVAAWGYGIAVYLVPSRVEDRYNCIAAFLFGSGLFIGACFRAVPNAEIAVDSWLKSVARLHDIGIGGGFVPAMIAAIFDQRKIVFKRVPGYFLTKVSFWMIVGGAVGTFLSVLIFHGVAGLMQRIFVIGIVLWLITEAHQLFWVSAEGEDAD